MLAIVPHIIIHPFLTYVGSKIPTESDEHEGLVDFPVDMVINEEKGKEGHGPQHRKELST
jgi:hypothetical protein